MPEFPGGKEALFKFLGDNVKYPPKALKKGIQGMVHISFVVTKDGSIENIHVKRGLLFGGAGLNQEAIRVIKLMPKWTPGTQDGKPVNVVCTVPFKFSL